MNLLSEILGADSIKVASWYIRTEPIQPPGTTHLMYITDMSAFYVLTGQVTYRMTYNQSPHIRVRNGIYHFVRRVPADLHQHYRSDRVSISLRTKSARAASRSAVSISQRLDDYWHGLSAEDGCASLVSGHRRRS